MSLTASTSRKRRPFMWLGLVALVAASACTPAKKDPAPSAAPTKPSSFVGQAFTGEASTTGAPQYLDGKPSPTRQKRDVEEVFFGEAIGHLENLRLWGLCAQELRAQSEISLAIAKAAQDFPRDLPNNTDPTISQALGEHHSKLAAKYEAAALAAGTAKLPCYTEPINHYRWVEFTADIGGEQRHVVVPDHWVVLGVGSIEDALLFPTCLANMQLLLEGLRVRHIDERVDRKGKSHTESEQSRALAIAKLIAEIKLLQEFPGANRC